MPCLHNQVLVHALLGNGLQEVDGEGAILEAQAYVELLVVLHQDGLAHFVFMDSIIF